jgi:hypothetical protein
LSTQDLQFETEMRLREVFQMELKFRWNRIWNFAFLLSCASFLVRRCAFVSWGVGNWKRDVHMLFFLHTRCSSVCFLHDIVAHNGLLLKASHFVTLISDNCVVTSSWSIHRPLPPTTWTLLLFLLCLWLCSISFVYKHSVSVSVFRTLQPVRVHDVAQPQNKDRTG